MGEVNVLALTKNNEFNFLLLIFCCIPHTYIVRYTVLQRTYPAELRAKVRRLAVASLSTPGPQITLLAPSLLGGWGLLPVEASRAG